MPQLFIQQAQQGKMPWEHLGKKWHWERVEINEQSEINASQEDKNTNINLYHRGDEINKYKNMAIPKIVMDNNF